MTPHQQEILLGGIGAVLLIGGGVYYLDKKGKLHLPSLSCLNHGGGPGTPPHGIAPNNLPSNVTRRCGTVFYSFGSATAHPNYIVVGKYVKGKLTHEYYQLKTQNQHFDPAGSWVGGGHCATSTSHGTTTQHSTKPPTTSERAAQYNWADLGNGSFQAQPGATLTGLSHVIGLSVATLAHYNCMTLKSVLSFGQIIHTTQQTCPSPSSNPTLSQCAQIGFTYRIQNKTQDLPCVARIQRRLNYLTQAGLTVDGHYGPKTEAAVKHFQTITGLTPSGIVSVGNLTWRLLVHPPSNFTTAG